MAIPLLPSFSLLRGFLPPATSLLLVVQAHAGLVLHYTFDETSGTTAADSSGNGNTGTLTNMTGSEWTTGRIGGGALGFDGSNDYVVMSGSFPAGSNARSVSAWFKASSFAYGGGFGAWRSIVGWGTDSWGQLFDIATSTNKLYWHDYTFASFEGSTALSTDTWYHVAATYDGSNKILYLNGSVDGTGSGSLSTTSGNGKVGRQADFNNNFLSVFNLLESRGVISVAQRAEYISRIRDLTKGVGQIWLDTQD